MRCLLVFVALGVTALALAVPAAAQREEMPTELWSEFPLVQKVERTSTPTLGPLLPPSDADSVPAADPAPSWMLWVLVAAIGTIVLLVVTGLRRPRSASHGSSEHTAPVDFRPHAHPRASSSVPLAQYAPSPSLVLADEPEGPRRLVVRRTGLLRSRYIVLENQSSGGQETVLASRSFWNVGGATTREHMGEDAWDDLVNDLRASGWEPDPTRRSDFYVLLQPVEPEESSIVPTIEAYVRSDESGD